MEARREMPRRQRQIHERAAAYRPIKRACSRNKQLQRFQSVHVRCVEHRRATAASTLNRAESILVRERHMCQKRELLEEQQCAALTF